MIWDLLVAASLVLSTALYLRGAKRGGMRWWETASFLAGWLTVAAALLSPVDTWADILFAAHMTQHELLMIVAAPLIVLGRPLIAVMWGLPESLRARAIEGARRLTPLWRAITGPFVVLILHGVVLWVWHIPLLFEAALRNEAIHALQHFTFFVTAALFWWALIHGRYGRVGYGLAVFFVFATAMHTSLLGALLAFTSRPWYRAYELHDHHTAGLIMWIPAGVIFMIVGLALFAAWLGESERRVRISEGSGR